MKTGFIFEVASRCNLNCRFCYNIWHAQQGNFAEKINPNSLPVILENIDETPLWFCFTGGEPLLRNDIETMAAEVFRYFPEINVGIATNGTLLTEQRFQSLRNAGVSHLEIPLHTMNPLFYSNITGGSTQDFENSQLAIARATSYGFSLNVSCVIGKWTFSEIADIIDLTVAADAKQLSLNRLTPCGLAPSLGSDLFPSITQIKQCLSVANEKIAKSLLSIVATTPIESCVFPHENYPNIFFGACVCGQNKWAVGPDGSLRFCEQSPEILGSLFEQKFSSLKPMSKDFRKRTRFEHCFSCSQADNCAGGCRFA